MFIGQVRCLLLFALLMLVCAAPVEIGAQEISRFDFAAGKTAAGWQAAHDISGLKATAQGLEIAISGDDPYLFGPPRDYPAGQPLWLNLRLKSEQNGGGQIFYFPATGGPNEADSVRFSVKGGAWVSVRIPLPPLGPAYRLRFDPPGNGGTCLLASLTVTPRLLFPEPIFPAFILPEISANALKIKNMGFSHSRTQWGGFTFQVGGVRIAAGFANLRVGYLVGNETRWLDMANAKVSVRDTESAIEARATLRDPDGGEWEFMQHFSQERDVRIEGQQALAVLTTVRVSQNRQIVWLPLIALSAGAGSFGESKNQALFGGLEYLDKDEPSRSEADIIGPGAQRQIPENFKITLPLMAIQQAGRYVGLTWDGDAKFSAVFDSPDRIFHSGGHLMALVYPGAAPGSRAAGNLLPYAPSLLPANQPLTLRCVLLGGTGSSVIPAVKQAFSLTRLPALPKTLPDFQSAIRLTAAGWLDSKLRDGGKFRHALPGSFAPQPAGDAALWLDYLAAQTTDKALAARLRDMEKAALTAVPKEELNFAGVGHVRTPAPALAFGATLQNAERAAQIGKNILREFEPDGSIRYRKPETGADLGRTHFAPDANGLTAQRVATVLELAIFSGDADLAAQGIRLLHGLDRFKNTVPRGAQTWEVPLHTPDILAAANLVRAYALGYELTGDKNLREAARYWAWTGIPFVYLRNPTGQAVGSYATIAVLGATQWVAPNWMGLPVQWCGLVYADALRLLARSDCDSLWTRIADGIAASGLQQTFPLGSDPARVGLLPDSFNLAAQMRNDPAINPGTLLSGLPGLYQQAPIYDFRIARTSGLIVHAPGLISAFQETRNGVSFDAQSGTVATYDVLITGLKKAPKVSVNGKEITLSALNEYDEKNGRLVLRVMGKNRFVVKTQ